MCNFIAAVLQEIHFVQICYIKKCEILIAAFANKSVTTTEKINKLEQITAVYRSKTRFIF